MWVDPRLRLRVRVRAGVTCSPKATGHGISREFFRDYSSMVEFSHAGIVSGHGLRVLLSCDFCHVSFCPYSLTTCSVRMIGSFVGGAWD